MGKVDFFVVEFYGDKRTYYPGEAINGTLRLMVNKELKLRGIRLEFHGKGKIHWAESSGSDECKHYRNSETYIDTLVTLFGKGKLLLLLKGHCHAIWQFYKKLEGVFASIKFQN